MMGQRAEDAGAVLPGGAIDEAGLVVRDFGEMGEPAGEQFLVMRLERRGAVIICHPGFGHLGIGLDLGEELRVGRDMFAAAIMGDGQRGRPFARLVLALVGAAEVCLNGNAQLVYLLQVLMRG